MARSARRHYRVAKKEIQHNPSKGVFIPKAKKKPITLLLALISVVIFIDGFILGRIFSRKSN